MSATPEQIAERLVPYLVARFLSWKLPPDFRPDAGISFVPEYNNGTPEGGRHEPTGTNLLNAAQAFAMFRYVLDHPAVNAVTPPPSFDRSPEYFDTLDLAYRAVDALGGTGASSAYNSALDAALAAIEQLGGMDAWQRKQKGYPNAGS